MALVEQAPGKVAPTDAQPLASPPAGQWRVRFEPSPALASQGIGVDRVRALLRDAGDIIDATPRVDSSGGISFDFVVEGDLTELVSSASDYGLTIIRDAARASPRSVEEPTPTASLSASQFVRVELARLDDLMRMIGDPSSAGPG